jgi:polar amino acid transport system substrate-binding protein
MHKFTLAIPIVVALAATAAAGETVRVGVTPESYPPFAYQDSSGRWAGWEIEIVAAVCGDAKLECPITPIAWEGMIPALLTKKIDMIAASMAITEERAKMIDFSDRYFKTPTVIVGRKEIRMNPSPIGLQGKTMGVQVSTIHEKYAQKHFASTLAEIKVYQTQEDAQLDLAAGRIDAVQADAIVLGKFLDTDQGNECCEIKGDVADDPKILGMGAGMGFRKSDRGLRDKINTAIQSIRSNGKYDGITKQCFDFDIYGN